MTAWRPAPASCRSLKLYAPWIPMLRPRRPCVAPKDGTARSAMTTMRGDEKREARMRRLRCRDGAASRFVQVSLYAPPNLPVWRDNDTHHRIAALAHVK